MATPPPKSQKPKLSLWSRQSKRVVFLSLLLLSALSLWPAACSQTPPPQQAQSADTLVGREPARPRTVSFLPHPAFAHASSAGPDASIADIAERALPSVVNIASKRISKQLQSSPFGDPFRRFFGPEGAPEQREEQGLGSGVIVSADGIILTNNHVIDKADEIRVTTHDKHEFEAEVVGTDEKSDLAVLRLKGDTSHLTPISFGDSTELRLGDVVLAIGNPFGVGQTVTMGIVSAKGRADVGIVDYEDFIQTDAAINPGNSGGALVNLHGDLVGINTAILSRSGGYQGIGFAIPSNMAKPIADSLMQHGRVVRGWLGVGIQDVDQTLAEALNLPAAEGVLVSDVNPGSPAEKAGLKRGDVIVSINDERVDSTGRLRNIISSQGSGGSARVALIREGKSLTLTVTLGELQAEAGAPVPDSATQKDELAGLLLSDLDANRRQQFEVPQSITRGALVERVLPGSPAAKAGIQRGDVVVEANRAPVGNAKELGDGIRRAKGNLLLLINRQGRTLFAVLKR